MPKATVLEAALKAKQKAVQKVVQKAEQEADCIIAAHKKQYACELTSHFYRIIDMASHLAAIHHDSKITAVKALSSAYGCDPNGTMKLCIKDAKLILDYFYEDSNGKSHYNGLTCQAVWAKIKR